MEAHSQFNQIMTVSLKERMVESARERYVQVKSEYDLSISENAFIRNAILKYEKAIKDGNKDVLQ